MNSSTAAADRVAGSGVRNRNSILVKAGTRRSRVRPMSGVSTKTVHQYRQACGASRLTLQYGCIALSVNSRRTREGARTASSKPSRPRRSFVIDD